MNNFSLPTENSAPRHFQASQGASNLKLREEISPCCSSSLLSGSAEAAASIALSAPGSAGTGATKVSKRRPRMNKKAPITVVSADTSNFRAMVQQLTGIPTPQASPHIWSTSGTPLLMPQPTRPPLNGASLTTLDTSAPLISPKQISPFLQRAPQPLIDGVLSGGFNNSALELAPLQHRANKANYGTLSTYTSLVGLSDAMGSGKPSGDHMSENVKELSECKQSLAKQSSTLFESLLMMDDDMHAKFLIGKIDSWLTFDRGALSNHSSTVDLAKMST